VIGELAEVEFSRTLDPVTRCGIHHKDPIVGGANIGGNGFSGRNGVRVDLAGWSAPISDGRTLDLIWTAPRQPLGLTGTPPLPPHPKRP
jgi:hypothetical protein